MSAKNGFSSCLLIILANLRNIIELSLRAAEVACRIQQMEENETSGHATQDRINVATFL